MSQYHFDHSAGHGSPLFISNLISVISIVLAGIFDIAQDLSPDGVYKWIFRILSVVSISLVIIINWQRAKQYFKREP